MTITYNSLVAIITTVLEFLNINISLPPENHAEFTEELSYEQYIGNFVETIERLNYDTKCIVFYETDYWNNLAITERKDKRVLYVEVVYGEKVNEQGDGVVLNTAYTDYNYIHYDDDVPMNTIIVTFNLYNPYNNYEDDIIERYDYWKANGETQRYCDI